MPSGTIDFVQPATSSTQNTAAAIPIADLGAWNASFCATLDRTFERV